MAARRSSIGTNPFDVILAPAPITPPPAPARQRFTVFLSPALQERARNAVYWSPGLSLGDLSERAFSLALDEVEAGNGGPFPQRRADLRGGRPVG